jgi:three-Cys-motif partner protein
VKEKDVKTNILPHTQAKLDLYKGYLEHYLRVLCQSEHCNKINLFDIYCGVGIYDDGKMGSPLLAIDCIKKIRTEMSKNDKSTTSISLLVNDKDVQKIENLKDKIKFQDIDNFNIEYYNKDANEMLDIVTNFIIKYPKDNRNLIFIDPYGYSDINKEKVINLLRNNCTEIILFLPVMQMYRFTEIAFLHEEKPHYENLRKFIISFFNNPMELMNTLMKKKFVKNIK